MYVCMYVTDVRNKNGLVVVYRLKARKAEGARALAMIRRQVLERKRSSRADRVIRAQRQKKDLIIQQHSREAAATAMSRRSSPDAESPTDVVVSQQDSPVKTLGRGTKEAAAEGPGYVSSGSYGDDLCPSASVLLRAVEGVLSAEYPAVTEAAPGEEDGGEEDRSRYIEALDRLQGARDLLWTALNSATEQDSVGQGESPADGDSPALVTGRGDATARRAEKVASKNASQWEFHCSSRGCARVVDATDDDVMVDGGEQPETDEEVEGVAAELGGACNGDRRSCGDR